MLHTIYTNFTISSIGVAYICWLLNKYNTVIQFSYACHLRSSADLPGRSSTRCPRIIFLQRSDDSLEELTASSIRLKCKTFPYLHNIAIDILYYHIVHIKQLCLMDFLMVIAYVSFNMFTPHYEVCLSIFTAAGHSHL